MRNGYAAFTGQRHGKKIIRTHLLIMDVDLKEKVEKYITIEEEALNKLELSVPSNSFLGDFGNNAMEMIRSYFSDAKHFRENGDLINAFAALNYSYGWIDCLVRLGVFDGGNDDRLFTLFR